MVYYEIILASHIDKKRIRYFEQMSMEHLPDGSTHLYGELRDQSELFSVLNKIRDMNLTLLSMKRLEKMEEKK